MLSTNKKVIQLVVLTCLLIFPSVSKAYTIKSAHGNLFQCDTMSRGIFIVWWDNNFNYSAKADLMLDSMLAFRNTCLKNLGMQDPLNAQDGHYCNIYIHTPGDTTDFFTANYPDFGNGVGGDSNGYPFMTLPIFVLDANYTGTALGRWINLAHETFHIFQTHGMWDITPGIYNTNDGGWFVEASANWFAYKRYSTYIRGHVEADILVRTPHVPLWLGWSNLPNYYPNNWQRQVHQYALSTYLFYLTDVAGITDSNLVSIFYSGTNLTPQEYLYNQIGGEQLRNHFIDCAAHMTNGFDFILPTQYAGAKNEWNIYADPLDNNQFIKTYLNTGSNGWFKPADSLTTNAWSFNTYKLINTNTKSYTFDVNADAKGTYGDSSYFQGKVLVQNSITGSSFYNLVMNNNQQGSLTLTLTANDTAAYFIIASMPKVFKDPNPTFQLYPYEMRIHEVPLQVLNTKTITNPKYEVARYNALGQLINGDSGGLQFVIYNDGTTDKVYLVK
jgi:Family of unknown function (DUF6055)